MAHILIIDDEAPIREVLARALADAGHTVTTAPDGRGCDHRALADSVDLVLCDLVMPERDGIETIMALRLLHPALPVIAMSGALTNGQLYLDIAAKLGVRRTLAKPFAAPTLLHAVNEALERPCAV
jgi:CheY-like chemotaxis protein